MKKKRGKRVLVAEVSKEEPKSLGRAWNPRNIDTELNGSFSALSVLSWNVRASNSLSGHLERCSGTIS